MIFGESLFGDGLFADGLLPPDIPPVIPPTGQVWTEQCPAIDGFTPVTAQTSVFTSETKQDATWIQQAKTTSTTDKCD